MVPADQNQNTVPADLSELKARLLELTGKVKTMGANPFEHLKSIEQDKILAEIISIIEKIAPEKASLINNLQEKKEALANAMYSFDNTFKLTEALQLKSDLIFRDLSAFINNHNKESMQALVNPPIISPETDAITWPLLKIFKTAQIDLENSHNLWLHFEEVKDALNSDISIIVTEIIKEFL